MNHITLWLLLGMVFLIGRATATGPVHVTVTDCQGKSLWDSTKQ